MQSHSLLVAGCCRLNWALELDQVTVATLLLSWPPSERVAVAALSSEATHAHTRRASGSRELLLVVRYIGHARELLLQKGIRARRVAGKSVQSSAGAVDKCSGGRVLCGNTEVSNVAEGILALSAGKKRVESGLMLAQLPLRLLRRLG